MILKLNATLKKQTTQNTAKQNYPGLVAFYDTWPGNEVGLFYDAPETTLYYSRPNHCIINSCRQTFKIFDKHLIQHTAA